MIGYKALRYLAAIAVGVVSLIGVFAFLWAFTRCSLPAIVFWGLVAYAAGIAIVWGISEPQKKKCNPEDVPIIDVRKEDYK